MDKKEFLNEEEYQKNNQKVKKIGNVIIVIGLVLLVVGIILSIVGIMGFENQFSNAFEMGQEGIDPSKMFSGIGGLAIGGFIAMPGIFITIVGLIVRFLIGNRREIKSYTIQQTMPVTQEVMDKMAPTIGKAGGEIAKGISKGIKEGLKDDEK